MTNGSELKSRGAQALRAAGYKPCPRWWLTQEQLDLVEYMARQNQEEVNKIRAEANSRPQQPTRQRYPASGCQDPWPICEKD